MRGLRVSGGEVNKRPMRKEDYNLILLLLRLIMIMIACLRGPMESLHHIKDYQDFNVNSKSIGYGDYREKNI